MELAPTVHHRRSIITATTAYLAASSSRQSVASVVQMRRLPRNDVTQQQVEGIVDGIASQLETDGGAMIKREYWGLRSLAYRIKKNRRGHYMLMGLDAKPAFVNEMERRLRLNEDILRFLTLGVNQIEQGPSAILSRNAEERDRNFRGPKPTARFDSGRRRSFGDREEFRARGASSEDLAMDPARNPVVPEDV